MQLCVGQAQSTSKYTPRSYHGLKYNIVVADVQRSFSLFPPVQSGGFFASGAALGLGLGTVAPPPPPLSPRSPLAPASPKCGLPRQIFGGPPSLRGGRGCSWGLRARINYVPAPGPLRHCPPWALARRLAASRSGAWVCPPGAAGRHCSRSGRACGRGLSADIDAR